MVLDELQAGVTAVLGEQLVGLYLYGSLTTGDFTEGVSDIDLLASFSKPVTLLQLVALERELSALLGRKVDLLTEASISPYLRGRILQEQRQIYAA